MSKAKNVRVKPIKLIIDDKTYLIKYDFNAFIELEEIYGSIDKAMEAMQGKVIKDENGKTTYIKDEEEKDGFKLDKEGKKIEKRTFSLKAMRDFLWAGLLYADEDAPSKKDVAHLLEFGNFRYITEKMMKAIRAGLPTEVEDESKN